jgi:crotonobetainyl-CoA:carnitine CoA-transferase CaiB-like acyl-CoA transferase
MSHPLQGFRLLTLATNLPGPVAAARLQRLGMQVIKVEPPSGDPLAQGSPAWYRGLTAGQEVVRLDLKAPEGRARLEPMLAASDLLLTATRPAALTRLGLDWPALHDRHPRLCQVALVGFLAPEENRTGHDLTYQASAGLLCPPALPLTTVADLAAAERAVSTAMGLLFARARGGEGSYAAVAIQGVAAEFAAPLIHGLTGPGSPLGGGFPRYGLYRAARGWVAVALLEPHFWERFRDDTGIGEGGSEELGRLFLTRTAAEWEEWAGARDLPIVAVRGPLSESPAMPGEAGWFPPRWSLGGTQ